MLGAASVDLHLLPLSRHGPFPWDSPSRVESRQTTSSQELFLLKTGSADQKDLSWFSLRSSYKVMDHKFR